MLLRTDFGQVLDYVCPFSATMYKTLFTELLPRSKNASYAQNVQFIFRSQVQPWHPSSTLVHEAALAVQQAAPNKFWEFSEKLMERQTEFFDVNVVHEGRYVCIGPSSGVLLNIVHVPYIQEYVVRTTRSTRCRSGCGQIRGVQTLRSLR